MAEKLSITIALDGAAEIERQLEGIGQVGTKAFAAIGTAAEKAGGFDKLDPKDVQDKLQKFGVTGKEAIDKITAAVASAGRLERIVGGVQQVEQGFAKISVAATTMSARVTTAVNSVTAGLTAVGTAATSTGGAVGRLARSFGLIGGGAIVASVGAAAVGMEKAADSARILESNLQALFRNQQAGSTFFNQIQNAAQTAGASLDSTAKTMIGIVQAIQQAMQARGVRFAPGEGLKQASKDAQTFFDVLQKGMQLSGTRSEEANKSIAALFNEIRRNGQLSGNTLRKLAAEFPQLANVLAKALGAPGDSLEQFADRVDKGLAKVDITKLINALKRADPEIQKLFASFDQTLAQRMDTIAGAWDRLLNSFGKSPSGAAIKTAMDDIAKGLDEIAKKQEQIGKFTVEKPPETVTGGLLKQMFDEFNQNVEIAKQNWERLKTIVSSPLTLALDFANLTPAGLAINTVINLIQKLRAQRQDKITVPFEADPEPPWVQAYLGFIEKVKTEFKSMFLSVAAEGTPEPAWVQAYLGFIEKVKSGFLNMFTQTPADPALEPAWVQSYLSWIQRVKDAFLNMFTRSPEAGGSTGAPGGPGMARGGLLRGRGTGTSDSNLAWVSRGEYIVPARVVRQPGVLALLEALRGSGSSRLKNGLPAFQEGGEIGGEASRVSAAIDRIVRQLDQAAAASVQGTATLIQRFNDFVDGIQQAENQMILSLGRMVNSFARSVQDMQLALAGGSDNLRQQTVDIGELVKQNSNQVTQSFKSAAEALRALQSSIGGRAGGGLLGGRGTGTSDSNLVRVSRGEYIIPARAVRQPGVLALLEALRRSGGSLRDVLDDMGRFALGGLVPRQIPAFANGGLVPARAGGGRPIALTINAGGERQTFHMWADEQVADSVLRYATKRQVASAGRKSGAFG